MYIVPLCFGWCSGLNSVEYTDKLSEFKCKKARILVYNSHFSHYISKIVQIMNFVFCLFVRANQINAKMFPCYALNWNQTDTNKATAPSAQGKTTSPL